MHKKDVTVFVHGYKGSFKSFDTLLERFEYLHCWGTKSSIYYVSEQGSISSINFPYKDKGPLFIQVIFYNSRATFKDTVGWLAKAIEQLKKDYQISEINLVGHSMGGIISLKFIEEYLPDDKYPMIKKFIAIGSPFDGIYDPEYFRVNKDPAAKDLKHKSKALQLLFENKNHIPKDIKVFCIASTGDVVAKPNSVLLLKSIVERNRYEEILIEDENLGHSDLHESVKVDQLIHDFLWGQGNNY